MRTALSWWGFWWISAALDGLNSPFSLSFSLQVFHMIKLFALLHEAMLPLGSLQDFHPQGMLLRSAARGSPWHRASPHSFFSWWPASVGEDGDGWEADEKQEGVSDLVKICTWRWELELGRGAGRKSGRRKVRTGAMLNDHCVGEQGQRHGVCIGRIASRLLIFKMRSWAQRTCLCNGWQSTLPLSMLV